ncbi:Holliday junction branch migration protein RuvA [Desulfobacterium sp. N47]|uniref:Holliday junction branch migration complex subunit RuvA n=1 Tax=uncultured Desulfobacterium sp. TaxID=201089 RepID=E1YD20_9BACT|nr:Holliday junction ATP-dependent DNA helicase ruvA [uncultured Desulfobacterium sp.]
MIGYLEGKLLKKDSERILLLVNHVGYEILLPAIVMETLNTRSVGDEITLYIYYHQSEKQPKPVLIGFNLEVEKEFFQYFISVEDIGPLKAVKALTMSVRDISRAIESKDAAALKQLKGIGNRTAQKIIATLEGKMNKFALIRKSEQTYDSVSEDIGQKVIDLLVSQLGYKPGEAKTMVVQALKRNKFITSPEDLLEEVYRGERT